MNQNQKLILTLLISLLLFEGCTDKNYIPDDLSVIMPTNVQVYQTRDGELTLTWQDNSDGENGFIIESRRLDGEYSEISRVEANVTSFTTTDLPPVGKSYYFAVSSYKGQARSYRGTVIYKVIPAVEVDGIQITRKETSHSGFGIGYIPHFLVSSERSYGICWSDSNNTPTVKDSHIPAPTDLRGKEEIFQSVPITHLNTVNTTYYIRAYSISASGKANYSQVVEVTLEPTPEAIKLEWSKVSITSLPSTVEVYKTTSQLSNRPFNAWYAIADPKEVDIKVYCVNGGQKLEQQFAEHENALVMTNAGYFWSGLPVDILADDQGLRGIMYPFRGTLKVDQAEYEERYDALRGFFGVDANGNPDILWTGTLGPRNRFYSHPQPIVQGEARYLSFTSEVVGEEFGWEPKYGISAGPVLIKDGKVPFSFKLLEEGTEKYLSNYELIPYDIFGKSSLTDRTAIGITAEGKVILFVCDGRIDASKGATVEELAQIMKGLGCVDGLNLDGGGSTGMVAGGRVMNNPTDRAVVTTIGFFSK